MTTLLVLLAVSAVLFVVESSGTRPGDPL